MKTKVKICGIRSLEGATVAVDAGADFLGFNFVRNSKRYINPKDAKEIIKKIKAANSPKIVGVFQNELVSSVNTITDFLELDYVQLHGREDPQYVSELKGKVIKNFSVQSSFDAMTTFLHMKKYNAFYYMLDRAKQGEGPMLDVHKVRFLTEKFPLFLAGGLTPQNVFEMISIAQPYAVDVASGVETDGNEDVVKIREFLYEAKL